MANHYKVKYRAIRKPQICTQGYRHKDVGAKRELDKITHNWKWVDTPPAVVSRTGLGEPRQYLCRDCLLKEQDERRQNYEDLLRRRKTNSYYTTSLYYLNAFADAKKAIEAVDKMIAKFRPDKLSVAGIKELLRV